MLHECAIQTQPVADVDAAQVKSSDRRPEQPLDKGVPADLLGVGADHCLLLHSKEANTTTAQPPAPRARRCPRRSDIPERWRRSSSSSRALTTSSTAKVTTVPSLTSAPGRPSNSHVRGQRPRRSHDGLTEAGRSTSQPPSERRRVQVRLETMTPWRRSSQFGCRGQIRLTFMPCSYRSTRLIQEYSPRPFSRNIPERWRTQTSSYRSLPRIASRP